MSNTRSFWVPLTFPTPAVISSETTDPVDLVEQACLDSEPCTITSWGLSGGDVLEARGVALGCKDGTVYLYHAPHAPRATQAMQLSSRSPSTVSVLDLSRPVTPSPHTHTRRASRSHPTGSRSASPSSLAFQHNGFGMAPRAQAVSGLSRQPVEAPKNYVDFDEEPDKLKGMLQGKAVREKSVAEHLVPSFDKGVVVGKKEKSSPPLILPQRTSSSIKRKDDARSLLSANTSPSFTPMTLSAPSSPPLMPPPESDPAVPTVVLRCHVYPRRPGTIRALHLVGRDRLLVSLQENGDVSVIKPQDGKCVAAYDIASWMLQPASGSLESSEEGWVWQRLCVLQNGESILLLACAGPVSNTSANSDSETDPLDVGAHVYLYDLSPDDEQSSSEAKLEPLGHWSVDGSADSVGLHREADESISFIYVNHAGHFLAQTIRILPRPLPPATPLVMSRGQSPAPGSRLPLPEINIHVPNPFKRQKSIEDIKLAAGAVKEDAGRVVLGDLSDGGLVLDSGRGGDARMRLWLEGQKLVVGVWSAEDTVIFEWECRAVRVRAHVPPHISHVPSCDVVWVNESLYATIFEDQCEMHAVQNVAENENPSPAARSTMTRVFDTGIPMTLQVLSASEVLSMRSGPDGRIELKLTNIHGNIKAQSSYPIWTSILQKTSSSPKNRLSFALPLDFETVLLGYDDGLIRRSSLAQMALPTSASLFSATSDIPLDGSITSLHIVDDARTKEKFIVGGSDDGSLAVWSYGSLKLCVRWTVFTTPLHRVTQLFDQQSSPLNGCVLCVALDGTIAVIVIDGFHFLHLIPGSTSPLQRISVGGENLLLIYDDGRVRLWDVQTTEFWRSTSADKAEELIGQGGWTELSLAGGNPLANPVLKTLPIQCGGIDAVSTILVDLEAFISRATAALKAVEVERNVGITPQMSRIRTLFSMLLTNAINGDIDAVCQDRLGIVPSPVSAGMNGQGCTVLYTSACPQDPWSASPALSASLALAIISLSRLLGLVDELLTDCNTVIAFYATSLPQTVGTSYKSPSLSFLARNWFEASSELRQAARVLFDAGVVRLSDDESTVLAEHWQHDLPCLQPDAEKELMPAAMALFICGYIAAEKYSLLSTSALTDIAKSIAIYLHNEQSLHRVLAIDLCSRGYHIWQHYVDAMEMLRALFALATSSRKESISAQNVGPQARSAVLQIAASNTPLFMTTLGLDILNPRNMEHRKSTMQLVAFLIRKRPLVLYPNLPRLMEAVVKSLDPNSNASREAVLDAATEILGHVVKTFPTVDFFMANQRLAVGTSEGAIIMYDLKTATRLYVLEGHKKRIAACSFSPDGRRLVTVSLEEGIVLVWKVGSSFASFFTPGAPPRQGHGGSEPFKTLPFNVGDEVVMSIAATLEGVRFEWTAERSVRLNIRESILTFST
ncbi:WD40 repeat-like protein [Athelia psychrophila]|uniref:WD40 repeat-like protein n=1 Tax=Athelia psychrophila TaxID=1759441 RepID=A0A166CSB0_9AGAM|nr:WD40 repeat-like protein [Fibularhizoctonia sp. CBS 109695]